MKTLYDRLPDDYKTKLDFEKKNYPYLVDTLKEVLSTKHYIPELTVGEASDLTIMLNLQKNFDSLYLLFR